MYAGTGGVPAESSKMCTDGLRRTKFDKSTQARNNRTHLPLRLPLLSPPFCCPPQRSLYPSGTYYSPASGANSTTPSTTATASPIFHDCRETRSSAGDGVRRKSATAALRSVSTSISQTPPRRPPTAGRSRSSSSSRGGGGGGSDGSSRRGSEVSGGSARRLFQGRSAGGGGGGGSRMSVGSRVSFGSGVSGGSSASSLLNGSVRVLLYHK